MKVLISGAGIGGLVTALCLHSHGIECEVHERVPELQEVGVGLTLLPHAMQVLVELGLLDALDEAGLRTEFMSYRTRDGLPVWEEPRGIPGGFDIPQISIHRGRLQTVLARAVEERMPGTLRLDSTLAGYDEDGDGVIARVVSAGGDERKVRGTVLIGAEGIHSTLRRVLNPGEGSPLWSGRMLWRGAVDWPAFGDGKTIVISGGSDMKFICYPIARGEAPDTRLTNWAVVVRLAPEGTEPPAREDWSREARHEALSQILGNFRMPDVDIPKLVAATPVFWEFPMCDREPLASWTRGRVTLLGDAAHAMYPFGANGAAQAILDATCLARLLASGMEPSRALKAYEAERLPKANAVVATNRTGGPERVIDEAERLGATAGTDIDALIPYEERMAIVRGYARTAGFDANQLVAKRA